MKHRFTRDFYRHWEQQRGTAMAPERHAMAMDPIRHLLADSFVLSLNPKADFPIRVAGTRVCALMGGELKGRDFLGFWQKDSRNDLAGLLALTSDESLATVAGVTARTEKGSTLFLELLLLPFARRTHTLETVTGLLAPLTGPSLVGREAVNELTLTTWRHHGHRTETLKERTVRRFSAVKGFVVYEGLRDPALR